MKQITKVIRKQQETGERVGDEQLAALSQAAGISEDGLRDYCAYIKILDKVIIIIIYFF